MANFIFLCCCCSDLVDQVLASGGEAALIYCIVNPQNSLEWALVVHHDRLKPYTLPLPGQNVPASLLSFMSSLTLEPYWFPGFPGQGSA